ncbi:MAG: hypothetical protein ACK4GW_06535 [Pseudorhodobacter sp.]
MMLIELTEVPGAVLPVAALKSHLRLGSGFAEDGMQDALMAGYLRAAIAVVEGRINKALLTRRFRLTLDYWRSDSAQALPLAPVSDVHSVTLRDRMGAGVEVVAGRYRLRADAHRPHLLALGGVFPQVPMDGQAEIEFDAGFGPVWDDLPADLAQAVLLLAAEYYEMRHEGGMREGAGLPHAVVALLERWRTVRVLGGGAA